MYSRQYSVRIMAVDNPDLGCIPTHSNNYVSGTFRERDAYVYVPDGAPYAIQLRNFNSTACEAQVFIDGKDVGTWVLRAKESATLTRPAHDNGRFTFYKLGSQGAADAELGSVSEDLLGLVSVIFTPERPKPRVKRLRDEHWAPLGGTFTDHTAWGSSSATPITPRGAGGTWNTSWTYTLTNAAPAAAPGGTGLSGHSAQTYTNVAGLDLNPAGAVTINLRLVSDDEVGARPLTRYSTPVPPPLKRR